jgi:hypothetical protein
LNFRFKDGKSTQREIRCEQGQRWVEFDPERAVKTIEICYREQDDICYGLRLLDTNQVVIAESFCGFFGYFRNPGFKIKKIELEEGEKILGIKCGEDV